MHACIHTYIHTYMHTYIHANIQTYVETYIHTYIRTYVRTYVHTYIQTVIPSYIHTYIHTCIHACILVSCSSRDMRGHVLVVPDGSKHTPQFPSFEKRVRQICTDTFQDCKRYGECQSKTYLIIHLPIYPSIYLFMYLFIHLSRNTMDLYSLGPAVSAVAGPWRMGPLPRDPEIRWLRWSPKGPNARSPKGAY